MSATREDPMLLPTRRALLGSAAAALVPGCCAAFGGPPGRIASPEVATLLDGLRRIDDGDPGKPRVRILFSPRCAHSLRMFRETRKRRMDAAWRWIPYGGDAKGRAACAAALASGDASALEDAIEGDARSPGGDVGAMIRQDDVIVRRVGRLLWDATGTALGTPTEVYARSDGLLMAARGSLGADDLAALLASAA